MDILIKSILKNALFLFMDKQGREGLGNSSFHTGVFKKNMGIDSSETLRRSPQGDT